MGRGAVWRGSGLPCGQRAACESTGDGRERGRRPCLRAPPHSPASRVCSSGGAQPRPPSTLPACAGTQGAVGACVFATALHSPAFAGLFSAAGSAAHAHGPLCASACKVIGPPAARMAVPPSRAPRRPCPWRSRFGVVRLRGLCARPGGSDGVCGSHRARVGRDGSRAPDNRRRPAGRPRRASMPL